MGGGSPRGEMVCGDAKMFSSATKQIMFLSRFFIVAHIPAEYLDWLGGGWCGVDCWS